MNEYNDIYFQKPKKAPTVPGAEGAANGVDGKIDAQGIAENSSAINTNGATINAGNIAAGIGGLASLFGSAYSMVDDITRQEDLIPRINQHRLNPNAGGSSLDSWTQQYLNNVRLPYLGYKQVGYDPTKIGFGVASTALKGMQAGSSFGTYGTIAGTIGGLGLGLWGATQAKAKANQSIGIGNKAIDSVYRYNTDLLNTDLQNKKSTMYNNLVMGLKAAYGGPLNMSGDGVMSPFGSRFAAGGPLHAYGSDWSNGLVFVNAGGSHEENPNEGVQMGIDPQGVPNLVEEGEVIYNDYVFSKRMRVPKKDKIKYKLGGLKLTYAEAAKKAQKESEERPNDPISKRGLEWIMAKLAESQETQREEQYMREVAKYAKQLGVSPEELLAMVEQQQAQEQQPQMQPMMQQPMMAAYGGELFTDGLDGVMYANGGKIHINSKNRGKFNATKKRTGKTTEELTHSKNPLTRKRAIFAQNAKKWKHGLGGNLFLYGSDMIMGPEPYSYEDKPPYLLGDNPYGWFNTQLTDQYTFPKLYNYWDKFPQNKTVWTPGYGTVNANNFKDKADIDAEATRTDVYNRTNSRDSQDNSRGYDWMTGLRFAPVLGSTFSLARNLLTPADYSRANEVARAYNNVNDIAITPKYNYMTYKPIDRMIMANMIGQQEAATRRNIMNTSGGNRGTAVAGLLASDNQYLNKLGEAFIAGDAENYKRYAQTLDANNNINKWLADVDFNVQRANQGAAEVRAKGIQTSRAMMDAIDAQRGAAISNDLTNLTQGLSDIGWGQFNRNMVNSSNPIYGIGEDGNVYFKGGERAESLMKKHLSADDYKAWKNTKVNSDEYAQLLSKAFINMQRGKTFSKGGYLTIKGRKK